MRVKSCPSWTEAVTDHTGAGVSHGHGLSHFSMSRCLSLLLPGRHLLEPSLSGLRRFRSVSLLLPGRHLASLASGGSEACLSSRHLQEPGLRRFRWSSAQFFLCLGALSPFSLSPTTQLLLPIHTWLATATANSCYCKQLLPSKRNFEIIND